VIEQHRIFIDGQAGTTGLELAARLADRADVQILEIDPAQRKDPEARQALMNAADVTVLCLPDDAAREAVNLAGAGTRILDASTAHRISDGWIYGCPEMHPQQRQDIAEAQRVSNPGCYPQGMILLTRPLIEAGLLAAEQPLTVFGLSGYSGGGRQLIEKYQAFSVAESEAFNTRPYGLQLNHKHVPEMQTYSGTSARPLFVPSVGNYYRGMLIQIPLFLTQLTGAPAVADVHQLLAERYDGEPFVEVMALDDQSLLDDGFLNASAANDTNKLQLMVFGSDTQAVLIARYDNLLKGASGAALQNLNLMLGVPETTGLV
jgi:N-acetyl-gamma-glutamyl-phosphate reductase